eukprot:5000887-Amphidinium_carterae.1
MQTAAVATGALSGMQPSAVRTVRQPTNEGTFAQTVLPDSHGPRPQNVGRPAHATHNQPRVRSVPHSGRMALSGIDAQVPYGPESPDAVRETLASQDYEGVA